MVSTETALIGAAVGLAGAEATGVTNLTGGGGDGGEQDGGGGNASPDLSGLFTQLGSLRAQVASNANSPVSSGPDLSGLADLVAASSNPVGTITDPATESFDPIAGPQPGQVGPAMFDLQERVDQLQQQTEQAVKDNTPSVPGGGDNTIDLPNVELPAVEAGEPEGTGIVEAAGEFIGENPVATIGSGAAVAAAPFTGGLSAAALAGGSIAGEVGVDFVTGAKPFNGDREPPSNDPTSGNTAPYGGSSSTNLYTPSNDDGGDSVSASDTNGGDGGDGGSKKTVPTTDSTSSGTGPCGGSSSAGLSSVGSSGGLQSAPTPTNSTDTSGGDSVSASDTNGGNSGGGGSGGIAGAITSGVEAISNL